MISGIDLKNRLHALLPIMLTDHACIFFYNRCPPVPRAALRKNPACPSMQQEPAMGDRSLFQSNFPFLSHILIQRLNQKADRAKAVVA